MKRKSSLGKTTLIITPPGLCPVEDAAARLITSFWEKKTAKRNETQWKDKLEGKVLSLLWECEYRKKTAPIDLLVLVGCLFGDRHSWSAAKYEAVSHLAFNYTPITKGSTLPRGAISALSKILKDHNGVLKSKRPLDDSKGNMERDYRRTIYDWLEDELFLYLWAEKHKRLDVFKKDPTSTEKIKVARAALSRSK